MEKIKINVRILGLCINFFRVVFCLVMNSNMVEVLLYFYVFSTPNLEVLSFSVSVHPSGGIKTHWQLSSAVILVFFSSSLSRRTCERLIRPSSSPVDPFGPAVFIGDNRPRWDSFHSKIIHVWSAKRPERLVAAK